MNTLAAEQDERAAADAAQRPQAITGSSRRGWRRVLEVLLIAAVLAAILVVFMSQFGAQIAGWIEVRCPWDAPLYGPIDGLDLSYPQCVSIGGAALPKWLLIGVLTAVSLFGGFAVDKIIDKLGDSRSAADTG